MKMTTETKALNQNRPNIYQYRSYQKYLKDIFDYKKEVNSAFSFRKFAAKADFSSASFLKLVIDGKRNLSMDSIAKVARGFELTTCEQAFLKLLVEMSLTSDEVQKIQIYKEMNHIAVKKKVTPQLIQNPELLNKLNEWLQAGEDLKREILSHLEDDASDEIDHCDVGLVLKFSNLVQ